MPRTTVPAEELTRLTAVIERLGRSSFSSKCYDRLVTGLSSVAVAVLSPRSLESLGIGAHSLEPSEIHASLVAGSGLIERDCTDMPEPAETTVPKRIDDAWKLDFDSAEFVVERTDLCAAATLRLTNVRALTSGAESVSMGDVLVANEQWNYWPPFECRVPGV